MTELDQVEHTEAMTDEEQWVINALMRHGPLDTSELRNINGSILPRGMPGHYILRGLEDMGLIIGRLPTREGLRVYSIVEGEDD
jgi:hypothetical protein